MNIRSSNLNKIKIKFLKVSHLISSQNVEKKFIFKKDQHGRAFLKSWLDLFDWLGYDSALVRAYCLYYMKRPTNT